MAKIRREEVVNAALELLNEVGLDALSTRRLAQKLGVESATLYWHFRDKSVLLAEMAALVLVQCHTLDVPTETAQWPIWLANNARSFRRALLAYRDGAKLHAGTTPDREAVKRVKPKISYLMRAGFTEQEARMVLLATSQFTIGCVLEEQARHNEDDASRETELPGEDNMLQKDNSGTITPVDANLTFEFGLNLIVDGLLTRVTGSSKDA